MRTKRFLSLALTSVVVLGGCRPVEAPGDVAPARSPLPTMDGAPLAGQLPTTRPSDREGLLVTPANHNTVRPQRLDATPARIAQLRVPAGFRIAEWARDLENPRSMVPAPGGGVYVAEREAGRVTLLRDANGDGRADVRRHVATGLGEGLSGVHGLAVHGNRLYMVTETQIHVAEIQADGILGRSRILTNRLPAGGQHPNRTLGVSPQGELFVSIGSTCNACVEPMEEHATIARVNTETGQLTVYARGLRNTIGFAWHPVTNQLYGLDHNTDERSDTWPPEELNRIVQGRHYGWPFCGGNREPDWIIPVDPDDMPRARFCQQTEAPALTYHGHAAPMQMVFYTGNAFGADYRNDAFATMRGSWNRNPPIGYEVVRIRFNAQGNPTTIEPFATGWLLDGGRAHFGRLMGIAQTADGALLVGDDENGVIYRISRE